MNAHDRTTLRKLRALMEKVDPDGWFIERGLSNRAVLLALRAAERDLDQLEPDLRDATRDDMDPPPEPDTE